MDFSGYSEENLHTIKCSVEDRIQWLKNSIVCYEKMLIEGPGNISGLVESGMSMEYIEKYCQDFISENIKRIDHFKEELNDITVEYSALLI